MRIPASQADSWTLLILLLGLASLSWAVLHQHPRLALTTWLVGTCLLPVWLLSFAFYFVPGTLLGVLVLVSLFPRAVGQVGLGDFLVMLIFVLALFPVIGGGGNAAATFALVSECLLGFTLGRVSTAAVGADWLYRAVGLLFGFIAALAVLEFLTSTNPFVLISRPNALYNLWGVIQIRGGVSRAEVSFGHSIALGCSLAMAVPLTLASSLRPAVKLATIVLLLAGSAVTFSRVGIICAVLGLTLSLVFMPSSLPVRTRAAIGAAAVAVAVGVGPFVSQVFTAAGSEATGSAQYRGRLTSLIPGMDPSGLSHLAVRYADGNLKFGTFDSIDSELILFGLLYGWIPLAALVVALAVAVLCVLARRDSPATISIVAQLPALATVALITQYRMLFWFFAGVAVATQTAYRSTARGDLARTQPFGGDMAHPPDTVGADFEGDQAST